MINNKNQLKKALKENKNNIKIKRIYNLEKNNKINVGDIAEVEHVQSNAFTIKYEKYDKPAWIYFDNIEVKENKIFYFQFIPLEKVEQFKAIAESENINIIELSEEEKEKANKYSNYNYTYKIPYIINEILEGDENE
jgi:hypothetical protein